MLFRSIVALFPGSFKPPHKGHLSVIEQVSQIPNLEKVVVLISQPVQSKRSSITAEEAKLVFKMYSKAADFGCDVFFEASPDASPITAAYKYIETNKFAPDTLVLFLTSEADAARFPQDKLDKSALKNETAPKVQAKVLPAMMDTEAGAKVSASAMRAIIENPESDKDQLKKFMPEDLSEEDKEFIIDMLTKNIQIGRAHV